VRKLFSSKGKRTKKAKENKGFRRYILHICIIAVFLFFVAYGAWTLLTDYQEDVNAQREYEQLREIFMDSSEPDPPITPLPEDLNDYEELEIDEDEPEETEHIAMEELARINQDLIGWISIKNHVEYPVVRGRDNDRYIYTTFSGERNSAGAIFMDYRNRNGFNDHITILYGHRARNGTMFSPLINYINRAFLQDNPIITITMRDGEDLTYRVFAARQTDTWDSIYDMGFTDSARAAGTFPNAPADASRFLLLSTCAAGDDRDKRIIVYAALDLANG